MLANQDKKVTNRSTESAKWHRHCKWEKRTFSSVYTYYMFCPVGFTGFPEWASVYPMHFYLNLHTFWDWNHSSCETRVVYVVRMKALCSHCSQNLSTDMAGKTWPSHVVNSDFNGHSILPSHDLISIEIIFFVKKEYCLGLYL